MNDIKFKDKNHKLLESTKFLKCYNTTIDLSKVNIQVIQNWIHSKLVALLGFEDDVLIEYVYSLLQEKELNPKQIQINLTGFLQEKTIVFMKELWKLLISAQESVGGIPQSILEQKKLEIKLLREKEALDGKKNISLKENGDVNVDADSRRKRSESRGYPKRRRRRSTSSEYSRRRSTSRGYSRRKSTNRGYSRGRSTSRGYSRGRSTRKAYARGRSTSRDSREYSPEMRNSKSRYTRTTQRIYSRDSDKRGIKRDTRRRERSSSRDIRDPRKDSRERVENPRRVRSPRRYSRERSSRRKERSTSRDTSRSSSSRDSSRDSRGNSETEKDRRNLRNEYHSRSALIGEDGRKNTKTNSIPIKTKDDKRSFTKRRRVSFSSEYTSDDSDQQEKSQKKSHSSPKRDRSTSRDSLKK